MSKVLSCYWNVYINGVLLDSYKKGCIESIEIDELCDGSDSCTIQLNDPDFVFIEDNLFVEEATVSIKIGWHGDTHSNSNLIPYSLYFTTSSKGGILIMSPASISISD